MPPVASFQTTGNYIHKREYLDPLCHRNQKCLANAFFCSVMFNTEMFCCQNVLSIDTLCSYNILLWTYFPKLWDSDNRGLDPSTNSNKHAYVPYWQKLEGCEISAVIIYINTHTHTRTHACTHTQRDHFMSLQIISNTQIDYQRQNSWLKGEHKTWTRISRNAWFINVNQFPFNKVYNQNSTQGFTRTSDWRKTIGIKSQV